MHGLIQDKTSHEIQLVIYLPDRQFDSEGKNNTNLEAADGGLQYHKRQILELSF